MIRSLSLALALFALASAPALAQVSAGGTPPALAARLDSQQVPSIVLPAVDHAALLAEDAQAPKDEPMRFGAPQDVQLDLRQLGREESLPDGGRLWRLRISSPGAHSLNFLYDDFQLPPGARLFLYNDDASQVVGAFTEFNNKEDGSFATQPVAGDAVTLEYEEPAGVAWPGRVRLGRVVHAYRNLFGMVEAERDYGDSGSCNNNVNCTEGNPWNSEIRSVAMILTAGGFRVCSGALVNNIAQDLRQYFLTANHCLGGETSWIFMFNYQSPSCFNQNGPTTDTVQGCVRRATLADSDFALLELNEPIPDDYNVVYAGWSAQDVAATAGVCIHHPTGDIKKISFENDDLVSDRYLGNQGVVASHWKVTDWDDGTTEPGSSGSPIFDTNHRIVGQLHGGYASCTSQTADWFGKFSMSWNRGSSSATRLRDWLDPLNTQQLTVGPLDPAASLLLGLSAVTILSTSDGDLVAEPGETVSLRITLINQESTPQGGIVGTLTSGTPWLTVNQGLSAWPLMQPQAQGFNSTAFQMQVSSTAPLAGSASLDLALTDGNLVIHMPIGLDIGQRLLYWQDTVEAGEGDFTHSAPGDWGDMWHVDTQDSHSASHSWKCGSVGAGIYDPHVDARLDLPPTRLWPYSRLSFWQRIQASVSTAYADSAYDAARVELSNDGGATWHALEPEAGYTHTIRWFGPDAQLTTSPFPPFTPCWSGTQAWMQSKIDLSEWGTQEVILRWRFGSDSNAGTLGWMLDDFRLEGLDPTPPPVQDLAIHWLGNGQVRLDWSTVPNASSYRVESRATEQDAWSTQSLVTDPGLTVTAAPGQRLFRVIALSE